MKQLLLVMILAMGSLFSYGQSCSANFTHQYTGSFDGRFYYNFTGDSTNTDSTLTYRWDFGDGYSQMGFNAYHDFAPGSYWVHLYVTRWDSTCMNTDSVNIIISDSMCHADFNYTVDTAGIYHFTMTSNGSVYYWAVLYGHSFHYSTTDTALTYQFPPGNFTVCLAMQGDSNCWDSTCKVISVPGTPNCNADFSYYIDSLTGNVHFTNTSTSNDSATYQWNFWGVGGSNNANPTYHFNPGTYNVILYLYSDNCWDSISKMITVPAVPCNADFTYYIDTLKARVYFTNTSTGADSMVYFWSFGNSSYAYEPNPEHVFSSGPHTVCLLIESVGGNVCWDSVCKVINVPLVPCNANYIYYVDTLTGNVHFMNTSTTNDSTMYTWSFGDATYSYDEDPVHYLSPGVHTVCLSIFVIGNGSYCMDSICRVVTVPASFGCHAEFTYSHDLDSPNVIHFINLSGTGHYYHWNFGNGMTATAYNPSVYFNTGTYTVCLEVEDSACLDSFCMTISVPLDTVCEADFTYWTVGTNHVHFIDGSMSNNDSTIYWWDFGDGNSGYGEHVTHDYAPGIYTVCHFIIGSKCSDSVCKVLTVYPGCNADFDYALYPDSADGVSRIVLFQNTSQGSNMSFLWIFGDSTTSDNESPVHYYDVNGNYTVCLIMNGDSCWDSVCKVIHISDLDSITGLASVRSFEQLTVYPVPFSDYLNIDMQSHSNESMNIRIYDILGILRYEENRMISTGKNQMSIHLDKLNKGIYFIELSTHEKSTSLKIIK